MRFASIESSYLLPWNWVSLITMTLWTGCFCRLLSENTKGLERILITYLLTRSLKTRKWDGLSDCSFPDWGGHLRTATERFLIFICRVSFFSYWTAQRPRAPVTRAHLLDSFFSMFLTSVIFMKNGNGRKAPPIMKSERPLWIFPLR